MKRIIFATGFAAGYVLGARAGRARYETLRRTARSVAERPTVQETAGVLQAQVGNLARTAMGKVRHTDSRRGAAPASAAQWN